MHLFQNVANSAIYFCGFFGHSTNNILEILIRVMLTLKYSIIRYRHLTERAPNSVKETQETSGQSVQSPDYLNPLSGDNSKQSFGAAAA